MSEIIMSTARISASLQSVFTDHADTFMKQLLSMNGNYTHEIPKIHTHEQLVTFITSKVKNKGMRSLAQDSISKDFVLSACEFLHDHIKNGEDESGHHVRSALRRARSAAELGHLKMSHLIIRNDIELNSKIWQDLDEPFRALILTLVDIISAADRLVRNTDPDEREMTHYGSMPSSPIFTRSNSEYQMLTLTENERLPSIVRVSSSYKPMPPIPRNAPASPNVLMPLQLHMLCRSKEVDARKITEFVTFLKTQNEETVERLHSDVMHRKSTYTKLSLEDEMERIALRNTASNEKIVRRR
jgi:hypothetical protein